MPHHSIEVWKIVRIDGLSADHEAADLNGGVGTVVEQLPSAADSAHARYEVHIRNREKTIIVEEPHLTDLYPAYSVRPSPGKEIGMFATRDLKAGETVMVERPIGLRVAEDWESLSAADHVHLSRLAAIENPYTPGLSLPQRILDTNQFHRAGILLVMSRVNHTCDANCAFEYDDETGEEILITTRDVAAGEELTESYLSEWATSAEGHAWLERMWGFVCTCPLCSATPEQKAARDAVLVEAKELHDALFMMNADAADAADATADRLLELLHQLGTLYHTLAAPTALDVMKLVATAAGSEKLSEERERLLRKWASRFLEGLRFRAPTTKWREMRRRAEQWQHDPASYVAFALGAHTG